MEIPEGCEGHYFLTNMEKPRRWGVLSEIPYVVGYGYFLETHSGFQMRVTFWIPRGVFQIPKSEVGTLKLPNRQSVTPMTRTEDK